VCLFTRGKLPQFAAYQEQQPAAADDVSTAATSGSGQQQQQEGGQAQLTEQQIGQQQELATSSASDPRGAVTALQHQQGEQQQKQASNDVQQQQQAGNGLPVLIGITNLYFIKMLPQWPNVVSVSKKEAVSRWVLAAHVCYLMCCVASLSIQGWCWQLYLESAYNWFQTCLSSMSPLEQGQNHQPRSTEKEFMLLCFRRSIRHPGSTGTAHKFNVAARFNLQAWQCRRHPWQQQWQWPARAAGLHHHQQHICSSRWRLIH
jgi:hypothetical protein